MDPILQDKLLGIGTPQSGTNMERNELIGLIRRMIKENKYTVDYLLNYAQSNGYQYQMASDIFEELTGMNPKILVNNNEYYQNPVFVPSMTLAWGYKKATKNEAYYIVPFEYGYGVMYKNEKDNPEMKFEYASIDEAVNKLKTLVTKVFTINKIITDNCLENDDIQLNSNTVHNVNNPYYSTPLQELKQSYINKVIDQSQFEKKAFRLVAEEKITTNEAEDAMKWLDELQKERDIEEFEDVEFGNLKNDDKMKIQEENKQLEGSLEFEDIVDEIYTTIGDEYADKNKLGKIYNENKSFFKGLDKEQVAQRLYELYLGFSEDEIKGKEKYVKKSESDLGDSWQANPYASLKKKAAINEDRKDFLISPIGADWDDTKLDAYIAELEQSSDGLTSEEETIIRQYCEDCKKDINASLKKKAADEDIQLEDIKDKDIIKDTIDEINDTDFNNLVNDITPEQYLEEESKNDQVIKINEKVNKIIDEFTSKFEEFTKYKLQLNTYKLQILNQGNTDTKLKPIEDDELNAQAIVQIIITIAPVENLNNTKKGLAIFSINKDKVSFNGTIRMEQNTFVAFSEEGFDAAFEDDKQAKDEIENLI